MFNKTLLLLSTLYNDILSYYKRVEKNIWLKLSWNALIYFNCKLMFLTNIITFFSPDHS